jgi:hypothetical protein
MARHSDSYILDCLGSSADDATDYEDKLRRYHISGRTAAAKAAEAAERERMVAEYLADGGEIHRLDSDTRSDICPETGAAHKSDVMTRNFNFKGPERTGFVRQICAHCGVRMSLADTTRT